MKYTDRSEEVDAMVEFEKLYDKLMKLEKLKNELRITIKTKYDTKFEISVLYKYPNITFEVGIDDYAYDISPKEMKKLGEWLRDLGVLD